MRNDGQEVPAVEGLPAADDVPAAASPIIAAVGNGGDLREAIGRAIHKLGFELFSYWRGRRDPDGSLHAFHAWGTFPERWVQQYRDHNFLAIDPRVQGAARSAVPVVWDQSSYSDDPNAREFFAALSAHRIRSGVIMAINQPNASLVDFFSVVSRRALIDGAHRQAISRTMGDLWAIGAYGHRLLPSDAFSEHRDGGAGWSLTPREIACLTLAAKGATSRAIGENLGISPRTVNAHIERAIRKCGAKSRQEAVARCLSKGIIPL